MAVSVEGYASQHHLDFATGDGSHVHVLTGIVLMSFQGTSSLDYRRDQLTFEVPIPELPFGKGLRVVHWAPYVAPASFGNEGPPLSVGWAVDGFRLVNTGPVIETATIVCDLAVRDPGSFLYRVAYSLHLLGQHDDLP